MAVGKAVGLSDPEVSRIERGQLRQVSLVHLARLLSVVGLELSARAYPVGLPIRDQAQLALLARFRALAASAFVWRTEVPVGGSGGFRAWDAVISLGDQHIGIEAETRLTDVQAVTRRIALKCRDSGYSEAILLLADTRTNRLTVRAFETSLRDTFPIPRRAALRSLGEGRLPSGSSLILV